MISKEFLKMMIERDEGADPKIKVVESVNGDLRMSSFILVSQYPSVSSMADVHHELCDIKMYPNAFSKRPQVETKRYLNSIDQWKITLSKWMSEITGNEYAVTKVCAMREMYTSIHLKNDSPIIAEEVKYVGK